MSDQPLIYHDEDITVDVTLKIERVVSLIAQQRQLDFDHAYAGFVRSRTHAALQNTKTLMWAESAEFIVDSYDAESAAD